ncbi:MAG: type II toxin-antitoxin system VapC family toxin [Desulfobacteraceae bacterium]|nr:MAG: type II toxin-antitoxin system VapC family toxin [Desulfobacteraceae bacterium]
MPARAKAIVLDSWSIIAYLEDEPSGEKVEKIIVEAHGLKIPLFTTVVNAGEVWYILARKMSATKADEGIMDIKSLGIEFVDVDWELVRAAAGVKANHKMSYADCFAAALAIVKRASLVTGDPEFTQVENEVKINWV